MCEKTIKLSLEQARKMYKKSPEMDELLLANFTKDQLEKPELPKNWDDLKDAAGYFISVSSEILKTKSDVCREVNLRNRCNFATEKQAKSALAMAQLSQLMKVYNGDWEPDWERLSNAKAVIYNKNNKIYRDSFYDNVQFLTFKTLELRDEFLKNFEGLIKQYFMLD